MRPLPRLLGFLTLLGLGCRPARGAGWEDARADFAAAQKVADWKERKDAYVRISDHDRPEAVAEIVSALAREPNPAVVLQGIGTLAGFRSEASRAGVVDAARKSGGDLRLYLLRALEAKAGPDVDALLLETARGGDPRGAALAADALGRAPREGARAVLLACLRSPDWQVRAAAARSLGRLQAAEALPDLAAALEQARGRDRRDLIEALQAVTGRDFGNDPAAWKALAKGEAPEAISRKPVPVPRVFGVPIYGQRVVVCLDNSLRMSDPHPFTTERLQDLCDPKDDGKPIIWFRVKTMGQFARAHVLHLAEELPKGSKLEVLAFNALVRPLLGRLSPVGAQARKTLAETLEGLETDDGIATYDVLSQALDTPSASAAWKNGPDEVVFITVNMPTAGEIKEGDAVAAAISLRARLRGVPVHAVGIGFHPYDMCRALAEGTGGTYVDLTK